MNTDEFSVGDLGGACDIDPETPSPARMYDRYLGGKDNFAADREAADEVMRRAPIVPRLAQANRDFLGRAVRYLATDAGIDQFLDLGTGLPTRDNVHEVAQRHSPRARVVYVDNDPIVLAHGRALLAGDGSTSVVQADMRDPAAIIEHCERYKLLDFGRPAAVLLIAVLHFITDDDHPAGIIATLTEAMAPGSYLVISHVDDTPELLEAAKVYDTATAPAVPRSRDEVLRLFDGYRLRRPGVVAATSWPRKNRSKSGDVPLWAGVGRKP